MGPKQKRSSRIAILILAITAGTSSGIAQAQTLNEMRDAARKDGRVVIKISNSLTRAFRQAQPELEKILGIRTEYLRGSATAQSNKILAERRAGKYTLDIWLGGPSSISNILGPAGAVQDMKPLLVLPEVKDPKNWLGGELPWASEWTLAIGAQANHGLIVYNPKLLNPDDFNSYWDILNPKWKGKIVMRDPRDNGVQSPRTFFYLKLGKSFFTRLLDEMSPVIAPDARQAVDWIAKGRYALCIMGCNRVAERAEAQGLPVKSVFPKVLREGYPVDMGGNGITIMSKPAHPAATKYFINWFLSREGQIFYQKLTGNFSLRIDIPRDGVEPLNRIKAEEREHHWYGWRYPQPRDESQVWMIEMMKSRGFQ